MKSPKDPRPKKSNAWHFFNDLYKPYWKQNLLIFFLFAVKHGVWMVFPLIIKYVIDTLIPAGRIGTIFLSLPVLVCLGIINLVCHAPYRALVTSVVKSVSRDLRNQIINKLQILSLGMVNKSESGRFYSKIMVDVTKAETCANTIYGQGLGAFFTFTYACTFLAIVDWKMTGVFLIMIPIYAVVYRLFHKRFAQYQHQARMADEDLSQSVSEFIQTNLLSRIHGEEEFSRNKVDERGKNIVNRYSIIHRTIGVFSIIIATTGQLFQMLVIAICAVAVIHGHMTLGVLVIFFQYMQQMVGTTVMVMDTFPTFVESAESSRSIQEILNSPDIELNESKPQLKSVRGDISFANVCFAYEKDRPALRDVAVTIPAGTSVALVGASGSGKTTFVNLALGMLRPGSGQILIDGCDINSIDMRSVRRFVGVVTQQPILFHGTVCENIAHARANTPLADIEDAARRANAHEFIMQLPLGYQTMIGEQGVTLSGGQRQRIAIARAILRRPSILVFDEATAALDSIAEKEVQMGIEALKGNQTTLTIAHRLSTIRQADLILVFHAGAIVERGTHEELIRMGGVYAALSAAQQLGMKSE